MQVSSVKRTLRHHFLHFISWGSSHPKHAASYDLGGKLGRFPHTSPECVRPVQASDATRQTLSGGRRPWINILVVEGPATGQDRTGASTPFGEMIRERRRLNWADLDLIYTALAYVGQSVSQSVFLAVGPSVVSVVWRFFFVEVVHGRHRSKQLRSFAFCGPTARYCATVIRAPRCGCTL